MRRVYLGLVCVLTCGTLQATPLTKVEALTTCIVGRSLQFCTMNSGLLGAAGGALPESLADLASVMAVTGESELALLDRSAELSMDRFSDPAFGPVVVCPQMMSSIQLSFDQRADMAGGQARAFAARRVQIELTLGSALTGTEPGTDLNGRSAVKNEYVNFALVNQAHISAAPAPSEEEAEEGDEASPQ
jgi:hypothetical protein